MGATTGQAEVAGPQEEGCRCSAAGLRVEGEMGQEQRARGLRWHSRAESSLSRSGDLTLPRALGCWGWGWCRWEWGAPEPVGGGEHRSRPEGRALGHVGGGSSGAGRSGEHRSRSVWGALEHVGVGSTGAGWDCGAGGTRPLQQKLPRLTVAPAPVRFTSRVPPGHGQGSPLYLSGPELDTPEEERAEPWPRVRCRGYPHTRRERGPRGGVPRRQGAGCGSEPGPPAPRAAFPFVRGGLQGAEETLCSHLPALVFLLTHLYGAPPGLRE